ncbi:MAG: dipeptide/oligopeptide/nickel ABC transporter ATP-binding protein [Eubacterium sp.]|nr:dipeptide/oligopeptide/nickel ABC transporter ATP-binding protein [Eubacterium sp.]
MQVCNVNKSYRDQRILKDISFEIRQNEILGLVGESGCGKSTLARLITRFEKPTDGVILYKKQNIQGLRREALRAFRRECQMVFQDNLSSLDPSMKILNTLKEPLSNNYKIGESEKRERIRRLMDQVDLNEKILPQLPQAISGGERQRVNICRALMMSPQLMVCDEITSSLDVITQAKLLRLIKELGDALGMTVLFISHDIDAVKRISDRVLVMAQGELVETLTRENGFVCSHPYTKRLFAALPISHPSKRQAAGAF